MNEKLVAKSKLFSQMILYGFRSPDMTVTEFVDNLPVADVEEVRHGKWIKPSSMSQEVCSNCNKRPMMTFGILPDYCPWCGAEMDLKGEECENTIPSKEKNKRE